MGAGWSNVVIPWLAELHTENGVLAVIQRRGAVGLREDDIIPCHSLNRAQVSWNPMTALAEAGMFERLDQQDTGPVPWTPAVDEYIDRGHSRNGLSRDRMGPGLADDFGTALRARITEQVGEGTVRMEDGGL